MKTLNIAILIALIGVFTVLCIQNVYAIPNLSPKDLYKQSDMVFHGQVILKQAGPGPDYYYYQIKVDTFFKNPQTSDSITAAGHKPVDGRMEYPQFEIGDKALFYTSKVDGVNTIGLFSQKAGMACDAQSFLGSAYLPNDAQSFSAVASNPRITDINGNAVVGKVQRGQPIQITYDEIWNNYPEYRSIRLHMSIQDIVYTKPAFEENRTIFLNACDGPSPAKLNFVPEKNGTYIFSLNIDGKLTTSTSFDVGDSYYSAGIIIQSPLKQFKSGVIANNAYCDCAFVTNTTRNVSDAIFQSSTSTYTPSLTLSGAKQYGTTAKQSGALSGNTVGTVTYTNIYTVYGDGVRINGLNAATYSSQQGDSGAPVTNGFGGYLYGVHSGLGSISGVNVSYYSPIDQVTSVLGATPVLG